MRFFYRRARAASFCLALTSLTSGLPAAAQQFEFDPADYGKIIVAPRQSTQGGLVLEQAFGSYQNEPISIYSKNSAARRLGVPVGRLDIFSDTNKLGFCTAFLVDDAHVVTNHHCVPGLGDARVVSAQLVLGYTDQALGQGAKKFQVLTEPVETNRELDYSVLKVFGNPSAEFGTVTLTDAEPPNGGFLWIIGHPAGQAQHISREGCAATDPAVSAEGKLVHSCDTLGGNSGSPVFNILDQTVIGLHHAGDSRTGFNYAIPMSRILQHSQILPALLPQKPSQTAALPEADEACNLKWQENSNAGCQALKAFQLACPTHPMITAASILEKQICEIEEAAKQAALDQQDLSKLKLDSRQIALNAELLERRLEGAQKRIEDIELVIKERGYATEQLEMRFNWAEAQEDIFPLRIDFRQELIALRVDHRELKGLERHLNYETDPHYVRDTPVLMQEILTRMETRETSLLEIEKQINDRFFAANAASGRISARSEEVIPLEDLRKTAKDWMLVRQKLTEERMQEIYDTNVALEALYEEMAQLKEQQESRPRVIKSVVQDLGFDLGDVPSMRENQALLIKLAAKRLPLTQESIDALPRMKRPKDVVSLVSNIAFDTIFVHRELTNIKLDLAREASEFNAIKAVIAADEAALAGGYHPEQILNPDGFDMTLLNRLLDTTELTRIQKEEIVAALNESRDDPTQLATLLEELRRALSPY